MGCTLRQPGRYFETTWEVFEDNLGCTWIQHWRYFETNLEVLGDNLGGNWRHFWGTLIDLGSESCCCGPKRSEEVAMLIHKGISLLGLKPLEESSSVQFDLQLALTGLLTLSLNAIRNRLVELRGSREAPNHLQTSKEEQLCHFKPDQSKGKSR